MAKIDQKTLKRGVRRFFLSCAFGTKRLIRESSAFLPGTELVLGAVERLRHESDPECFAIRVLSYRLPEAVKEERDFVTPSSPAYVLIKELKQSFEAEAS